MKKICSIVQEYYPKDFRVRRISESLVDKGFNVDIVSLRNKFEKKKEVINNVVVHRINFRKKRGSQISYILQYLTFSLLAFFKCSYLFIKNRYDVIVINNPPDFLVFAAVLPKIFGARIIIDLHEIVYDDFKVRFKASNKKVILQIINFLTKISLWFVDDYITVNDALANLYSERYKLSHKPAVVMNSVSEEKINKNPDREKHTNKFTLMYHGTLSKHYGIHVALHALHELIVKKGISNIYFHVFGDGVEKENLEKLANNLGISDYVIFHGYLTWEKIEPFINSVNVELIPTIKSDYTDLSLSNKLMECVYFEIPIIASNIKTYMYYFPPDLISYFTSEDAKDLSGKIEYAFNHYYDMKKRASEAYKHYGNNYQWKTMMERYINVLIK